MGFLHWKDLPNYRLATEQLAVRYPDDMDGVDDQACFALCWKDDDGTTCPIASECSRKSFCESAWRVAQVESAKSVFVQSLGQDALRKPLQRMPGKRHKWRHSTKYDRVGYTNVGYLSDRILSAFLKALGEYTVYKGLQFYAAKAKQKSGDCTVCVTASYSSVVMHNCVVARAWTNAKKVVACDVVPEMVRSLDALLGCAAIRNPTSSWRKLRPCTHRYRLTTEAQASVVGDYLRKWNLE